MLSSIKSTAQTASDLSPQHQTSQIFFKTWHLLKKKKTYKWQYWIGPMLPQWLAIQNNCHYLWYIWKSKTAFLSEYILLKISSFHFYYVSSGWYDQLFRWKSDKCLKKLRSNKTSDIISTNEKDLSAKYFYSVITSRGLSICITYHLHKTVAQSTSNCAPNITSLFIVDNIYYFVIKRLSALVTFRPYFVIAYK